MHIKYNFCVSGFYMGALLGTHFNTHKTSNILANMELPYSPPYREYFRRQLIHREKFKTFRTAKSYRFKSMFSLILVKNFFICSGYVQGLRTVKRNNDS